LKPWPGSFSRPSRTSSRWKTKVAEDTNRWGEAERRRRSFAAWLWRVWEWAEENSGNVLAGKIAELMAHADEPDYPMWEEAKRIGILGESMLKEGKLAKEVRDDCGIPVDGPKPDGWERQINFSPAINLDLDTWEFLYRSLGWANRNVDPKLPGRNFYLWSPAGNLVYFMVRPPVRMEAEPEPETE